MTVRKCRMLVDGLKLKYSVSNQVQVHSISNFYLGLSKNFFSWLKNSGLLKLHICSWTSDYSRSQCWKRNFKSRNRCRIVFTDGKVFTPPGREQLKWTDPVASNRYVVPRESSRKPSFTVDILNHGRHRTQLHGRLLADLVFFRIIIKNNNNNAFKWTTFAWKRVNSGKYPRFTATLSLLRDFVCCKRKGSIWVRL